MIESNMWLGTVVSGMLVKKGKVGVFVANALAAVR